MPKKFENNPTTTASELPKGSIMESGLGRPLEIYLRDFNIDLEDLKDKDVLDLGAGLENRFAEGLKKKNIQARVFSLSLDFSDPKIAKITNQASPEGNLIAGLSQKLPSKDESFDRIYGLHIYEHIISPRKTLFSTFGEIARVLKKRGIAKIGPLSDVPHETSQFEIISKNPQLISVLAKYKVTLEKEEDSPESPDIRVKDDMANTFYVRGYNLLFRKSA